MVNHHGYWATEAIRATRATGATRATSASKAFEGICWRPECNFPKVIVAEGVCFSLKAWSFHFVPALPSTSCIILWLWKCHSEWKQWGSVQLEELDTQSSSPSQRWRSVRKKSEKNVKKIPGSKIFHAKAFRIKRVNRNIFYFTTNVRKTRQFYVF